MGRSCRLGSNGGGSNGGGKFFSFSVQVSEREEAYGHTTMYVCSNIAETLQPAFGRCPVAHQALDLALGVDFVKKARSFTAGMMMVTTEANKKPKDLSLTETMWRRVV